MGITEDEARGKRCPKSFEPWRPGGSLNYGGGGESWSLQPSGFRCNCLASECMAWRWFDDLSDDGTRCNRKPTAKAKREPEPNPEMGRDLSERRGYCGLAGNP